MHRSQRGLTLIELLVVIVMIGILTAIVVPRFRVSAQARVRHAAQKMANDIELTRTRSLATASAARMVFDAAANAYGTYLDDDRDGIITQSPAEMMALHGFGTRPLTDGVQFGRSSAPQLPEMPGAGDITFPASRLDFDTRGITAPVGTRGAVYLTSSVDPAAIAAVSVTAAAGVRVWIYQGGTWR